MNSLLNRRHFLGRAGLALGTVLLSRRALFAAENSAVPGLRVFIMAHSFHIFVAQRLPPVVTAAGIKGHELAGRQMIGGSRVKQHWDLPDEKNEAKKALREGKVDVLTMSPNLTVPDEGIERFVELGLQHNPKLRVLVQVSWIPWDGETPAERVPNNEARDGRSLDLMRTAYGRWKGRLESQLRALNQKLGREVLHLVPVGDAVIKLRELIAAGKAPGITKQSDLFTDQIGHGKPPIVMLTTYCNFASIYRTSPVGLNDPQPELDRLSPELKPLLQRLAWEAVTAHPMSGVKAAGARK
jgi:hypothetical protein